MKTYPTIKFKVSLLIIVIYLTVGCEDFLETDPTGTTTLPSLSNQLSGAESLLIAAYSSLDGLSLQYDSFFSAASNWVYGSIAGGDAYKGSTMNDQPEITEIELHKTLSATNPYLEGKWAQYYAGVARANDAIRAFKMISDIDNNLRQTRIAEAQFLRGYYHFELRKIFGKVPYIDETIEDVRIGNEKDILDQIMNDFRSASSVLPLKQEINIGRVTKGAAWSYLGICYMWNEEFANAKSYFDSVTHSGRYALNKRYHDNFNPELRNNPESILEVQQSVNDGANGWNGGAGDIFNYPNTNGYCCSFHQPSQNLVNAFKTDAGTGLPLLDDYNSIDVTNDEGVESDEPFNPYQGTLDPRLDWTVGRRAIPYLDWGIHTGKEWVREQADGGPYSPKKNAINKSLENTYAYSGWVIFNANNYKILRYSDLLLFAAEAEVELGNLSQALELVNAVRERAANADGFVKLEDGVTPAANYYIKPYSIFPDKEFARKAVRFERRIELGMEGHRFFDLVRWKIAAEEINAYFMKEKEKRSYLSDGQFKAGKHEVLPIPQAAINLSYKNGKPTLVQNPGY